MTSPPWSSTVKSIVAATLLVLAGLTLYWLRSLVPILALSLLAAYLLAPLIDLLERWLHLRRSLGVTLVYLLILAPVIVAPASFIPSLIAQLRNVELDVQQIVRDLLVWLQKPMHIGNFTFQLEWLYTQVSQALANFVSRLAPGTVTFIFSVAGRFVEGFLVLVFSSYFLIEGPGIVRWLVGVAPPGYEEDFRQLLLQINAVWNGFFRAQLLQALLFGSLVTLVMGALGIRSAVILGLVAGVMEIAPRVGHTMSAIIGTTIVFFEGSAYIRLGESNFWIALLILGVYMVLNEVDTNYLLPNLIGRRVHLSPMVILFGIVAGAVMGGVLGVVLATPVIGTLRVLVRYLYTKLFDLPTALPLPEEPLPRRSLLAKAKWPASVAGVTPLFSSKRVKHISIPKEDTDERS